MPEPGRKESSIDTGDAVLKGWLDVPDHASGIVVFVHGSGSSRYSKRNNAVAAYLRRSGLGTLLFDLLTDAEERIDVVTREYRFDIPLLCKRLAGAIRWLSGQPESGDLPIGLFGSSTGAAAALIVAAQIPERIDAVVSRGGRADLAGEHLRHVKAPTLLIVGGADVQVLQLNQEARAQMTGPAEIAIVKGATHLFEESGALEQVEALACNWFLQCLAHQSAA